MDPTNHAVSRNPRGLSLDVGEAMVPANQLGRGRPAAGGRNPIKTATSSLARAFSRSLSSSTQSSYQTDSLKRIGRGGFGEVYQLNEETSRKLNKSKARYPRMLRSEVAESSTPHAVVKQVLVDKNEQLSPKEHFLIQKSGCMAKPQIVNRFNVEQVVLRELKGDHAPKLLDVKFLDGQRETAPGAKQIVMTKVDGMPLNKINLASEELDFGEGFEDSLRTIMLSTLDAIEVLHNKGYAHNDIKPSNLIIDKSGKVWVVDLGLASPIDKPHLFGTGTKGFYPDIFGDANGAQCDLHAIGKTAVALLEKSGKSLDALTDSRLTTFIERLDQDRETAADEAKPFTSTQEAREVLL